MSNREEFEATFMAKALARGVADPERLLARNAKGEYELRSVAGSWVGWCWALEWTTPDSVQMAGDTKRVLDWTQLSERGVLGQVNDLLRAHRLAVVRVVETGLSPGAIEL